MGSNSQDKSVLKLILSSVRGRTLIGLIQHGKQQWHCDAHIHQAALKYKEFKHLRTKKCNTAAICKNYIKIKLYNDKLINLLLIKVYYYFWTDSG